MTYSDLYDTLLNNFILFNKDNNDKKLIVFLGKWNKEKLHSIRKQLSEKTCLFYIFDNPAECNKDEVIKETIDSLTFPFPLINELSMKRLVVATMCIKLRDVQFLTDESLSKNTDVNDVTKAIYEGISTQINELNTGLIKFRSSLFNLKNIIKHNYKVFVENKKTASIICSAGPSLAKQLNFLKKNADKFYIIAVGKAMKSLINAKIMPDFIVEIESNNIWDNEKCKSILVATTPLAPQKTGFFDTVIWKKANSYEFNNLLKILNIDLPEIITSISVTSTAIDFATEISNNIVLIGNDLSFYNPKQIHIGGGENERVDNSIKFIDTVGYDGETLATTEMFDKIRRGIESAICAIKVQNKDVNIYNATEKGAVINNTTRISLDDFGKQFSSQAKSFKVKKINNNFDENLINELINQLEEFIKGNNNNTLIQPFIDMASNYTENILFDSNNLKSFKQSYIKDLITDFKNDLTSENKLTTDQSLDYLAFKNIAIEFINKSNPEFADFLKQSNYSIANCADFQILSNNQGLPFISQLINGKLNPLYYGNKEYIEGGAKKEVKDFISKTQYNMQQDAVIFEYPGCWFHIQEFSKLMPKAKIMVLEPNIELFSIIIRKASFIHHLPSDSVIIGVHEKLKQGKRIKHKTIRNWKKENRRILTFTNKYLKEN